MDYTPRHPQPFTLAQAVLLDIQTISQEVSRLQHSLLHLKRTQDELRDHASTATSVDPVIQDAIEENEIVIASQEERIGILKIALVQKGVDISSGHYYDTNLPSDSQLENLQRDVHQATNTGEEDDTGVYL